MSLVPPVLVKLTLDLSMVGTYLGMSLFLAAFELLIGNPVARSLVKIDEEDFVAAQAFTGAVILAGTVLLSVALFIKARQMKTWKV